MILNLKFPPIDGYDSPCKAIAAGKALHAANLWFKPEEAQGQTIVATSYSLHWFALMLSNGKRILIRPGESKLAASLDEAALPPAEPLPETVKVRSQGQNGLAELDWKPHREAQAMLNRRIEVVWFHPHRLVLVFPKNEEAWFWLATDEDKNKPVVKWSCDEE
jgi:hypothetical protein